jgi:ankyrin repeat protein
MPQALTRPQIARPYTAPPVLLEMPNEIMDLIIGFLSDGALGNLRATTRCLHSVALSAWHNRVLEDKDGIPALEWAVRKDQLALVVHLLTTSTLMRFNLNIRPRGRGPETLLGIACRLGGTRNLVARALINYGADINYAPPGGFSALLEASNDGRHNIVQMLLELGADACLLNYDGSSIIHLAARRDHIETLQIILAWENLHPGSVPDIGHTNVMGMNAYELACLCGSGGTTKILFNTMFPRRRNEVRVF